MIPDAFQLEALVAAAPLSPPLSHRVRFQDIDAAGVVFYPRLFEYFHDCYVVWLRQCGQPLERVLAKREWAAPIQWAEGHFLRPLRFGDSISTGLVRAHLEGSELWLAFKTALATGEVAAVGVSRAVFVDLATFRRTDPPAEMVRLFREIEAG